MRPGESLTSFPITSNWPRMSRRHVPGETVALTEKVAPLSQTTVGRGSGTAGREPQRRIDRSGGHKKMEETARQAGRQANYEWVRGLVG